MTMGRLHQIPESSNGLIAPRGFRSWMETIWRFQPKLYKIYSRRFQSEYCCILRLLGSIPKQPKGSSNQFFCNLLFLLHYFYWIYLYLLYLCVIVRINICKRFLNLRKVQKGEKIIVLLKLTHQRVIYYKIGTRSFKPCKKLIYVIFFLSLFCLCLFYFYSTN